VKLQISIWPEPNLITRVRFFALLGVLAIVVFGTLELKHIAGEAGEAALRVGLAVTTGRLFPPT
jgi:hypothetical protein